MARIDLSKKGPWIAGGLAVTFVAVIVVTTVRGQAQRELAQRFLDAVRKGDRARAEALSDGDARVALRASYDGPYDGPSARGIAVVRESASNTTSYNVTTGVNTRCVEATSVGQAGGKTTLYMRIESEDGGWRVTGISTRASEYGICDSD